LAMLQELNSNTEIFTSLQKKTAYLHEGIEKVLTAAGVTHQINRIGSMISVHFCEESVTDFASSAKGNNDTFKKFFHGLLDRGIYIAPSAFESWFLSDALSYDDLDKTIQAIKEVAEEL